MTDEILNKAHDYAFMHYGDTDNDGNPLTDDIIMQRSFLAGYEQAEKELLLFKKANEIIAMQRDDRDRDIAELEEENAELKAQIEKMQEKLKEV